MRRNKAALITRQIERAAFQSVNGVALRLVGPAQDGMQQAGQNDPATGAWVPYGLLDLTELERFRLAGGDGGPGAFAPGLLDVTALAGFRLAAGGIS